MPSWAEKVWTKPLAAVVLVSLALLLSGNWILPLMDRDEPRFAEASREMLQRQDALIPWFNGQYRFDKPPLIYWCQSAAYLVLGDNPFAARLPSALFTTAAAVLLLLWGRALGRERAGLCAAMLFVTCLQVLIHGRLAVADMPMVFFVLVAVWSGWEMSRPGRRQARWWWFFYLSLGLGFLAKGPVAWLPLAGVLVGRWRRPAEFHLGFWPVLSGMMLSLLVVALWGVPALLATKGQFFTVGIGHHVVYRSFDVMEGHGGPGWIGFLLTLPLYLLTFFFSFFPWSLKVPGALRAWWSSRKGDLLGWYLLVQAALVFAVFTLVRTKLPHYTLPAFPMISLWLALRLTAQSVSARWPARPAVAMCLLAGLITLGGFTALRPYFVAASLYRQTRPLLSPNMEFAAAGFDEPSLVWEFRRSITNYLQHLSADQAKQFLQSDGPRLLILPAKDFTPELRSLATNCPNFHAAGLDTARFRRLDLVAVIKGPAAAAVPTAPEK